MVAYTTEVPKGDPVGMEKRIFLFYLRYKRISLSTLSEDLEKVMSPVSFLHRTITNTNQTK